MRGGTNRYAGKAMLHGGSGIGKTKGWARREDRQDERMRRNVEAGWVRRGSP